MQTRRLFLKSGLFGATGLISGAAFGRKPESPSDDWSALLTAPVLEISDLQEPLWIEAIDLS